MWKQGQQYMCKIECHYVLFLQCELGNNLAVWAIVQKPNSCLILPGRKTRQEQSLLHRLLAPMQGRIWYSKEDRAQYCSKSAAQELKGMKPDWKVKGWILFFLDRSMMPCKMSVMLALDHNILDSIAYNIKRYTTTKIIWTSSNQSSSLQFLLLLM